MFVLRSKFEIYMPDYPITVFLKLGLAEQFIFESTPGCLIKFIIKF